MAVGTKIDPKKIYQCVIAFSGDVDGVPVVYNAGERLMGSDEAVRKFPDMWAPEDDLDELASKRKAAWMPAWTAPRTKDTSAPRVTNVRLRAKRNIALEVDGLPQEVKKGDLLDPSDPLGVLVPNGFERVEVVA